MKPTSAVYLLCAIFLALYSFDSHAQSVCTDRNLNQISCQSKLTVQCLKEFSPAANGFIYRWEYVNSLGQAFDAPPHMLGKTGGYTPKPCQPNKYELQARTLINN